MPTPKTGALPLGDAKIAENIEKKFENCKSNHKSVPRECQESVKRVSKN
tara:strand:+ start:755 stop:901 length:147 start_codon:yes stop_codon:yes gene_type:complete